MSGESWAISGDGGRLVVRVHGRMYPKATDYWDGNWLTTKIIVDVGAFHAEIGAGLHMDELHRFREELDELYRTLSGSAQLKSMEEWIDLLVKVDNFGHIAVDGQVRDRAGEGNRLLFKIIGLDQTDLPALLEGLAAVEAAYPVLGHP
jgi:hypothetical protein